MIGLMLALVLGTFAIVLLPKRPAVSMTFVKYARWPNGAIIRLTNGTGNPIRYLAEGNGTPAGSPVLCRQKTSNGWTDLSPGMNSSTTLNPSTGKMEAYFWIGPAGKPTLRGPQVSVSTRSLKPGHCAEFFIRLEPDAVPKQVGTVCIIPQSEFAKVCQPWLLRIQQWCRIKPTTLGQIEVWCPEQLQLPPPAQPGSTNQAELLP